MKTIFFRQLILPLIAVTIVSLAGTPAFSKDAAAATMPIDAAFEKAKDLFLNEKFKEAEETFRRCLEAQPKNAEIMSWLAQSIAFVLGEQAKQGASRLSLLPLGQDVRSLYSRAMEIDPNSERARIGYALILRDLPGILGGDVDKAEAILTKVLEQDPENILACHHLGNLYIRKKDEVQKGLHFLKRALEVAENKELTREDKFYLGGTWHAIGKTYLENLEEPETALPYLKKSVEMDPNDANPFLDLAEAYRQTGQEDLARQTLRDCIKFCKDRKYKFFYSDVKKLARKLGIEDEAKF
ncbi:MAG: tetratricopeptide repeat protein [bacterium]|nr:tetratricopeptide repeat protein [bacterium]